MQLYTVYVICKLLNIFGVVSPPIIRSCRYSYLCSWWWAENPPETCRAAYR